jgi:hypothetical protein
MVAVRSMTLVRVKGKRKQEECLTKQSIEDQPSSNKSLGKHNQFGRQTLMPEQADD